MPRTPLHPVPEEKSKVVPEVIPEHGKCKDKY